MPDVSPDPTLGTQEEYEAYSAQYGKDVQSLLGVLKLLLLGRPPEAPGGPVFGLIDLLGPLAPALKPMLAGLGGAAKGLGPRAAGLRAAGLKGAGAKGPAAFVSPETKAYRAEWAKAHAAGDLNLPPPTGPDPSPKVAGVLDELGALIKDMYRGKRFPSREMYPEEDVLRRRALSRKIEGAAWSLGDRLSLDPNAMQRPGFPEAAGRLQRVERDLGPYNEKQFVEHRLHAAVERALSRLSPRQEFIPFSGDALAEGLPGMPRINQQPIISMKSQVFPAEGPLEQLIELWRQQGTWP